jgi:hypothetical protein
MPLKCHSIMIVKLNFIKPRFKLCQSGKVQEQIPYFFFNKVQLNVLSLTPLFLFSPFSSFFLFLSFLPSSFLLLPSPSSSFLFLLLFHSINYSIRRPVKLTSTAMEQSAKSRVLLNFEAGRPDKNKASLHCKHQNFLSNSL